MGDHVASTTVYPTGNDLFKSGGASGDGKGLREERATELIRGFTRNFVLSGLTVPNSDADLIITVAAGKAIVYGHHLDVNAVAVTAAANNTNYVYLKVELDGNDRISAVKYEVNTTGTPPTNSVLIAILITDADNITETANLQPLGPLEGLMGMGPSAVGSGSTRTHEGSTIISGATNLGGVHFYSDFTLKSGITLTQDQAVLIIFASKAIAINGTIDAIGEGQAGGAGGGSPGTDGTDQGGGGGGSPGGGKKGGDAVHGSAFQAGGATGSPGAKPASLTGSEAALLMTDLGQMLGGAGGGGGGGATGGEGGAGGGTIVLIAPNVTLASTATITTRGANGANAINSNDSGGGGGGAGNLWVLCRKFTDNGATLTLTGGAAGSGVGPGEDGGAGGDAFKQILIY